MASKVKIARSHCQPVYILNSTLITTQYNHCFIYSPYTGVSQHLQLRTGGFCWYKVLLPVYPCWWQPVHSDQGEDAAVLVNIVTYTVSLLGSSTLINACNIFVGLGDADDRKEEIWKFIEDNKQLKDVHVPDMRHILPLLLMEGYSNYYQPYVRKGNWLLMWLTITVTVSIMC